MGFGNHARRAVMLCVVATLCVWGGSAQAACGTATDRPKVGLVLSGGGALGAAHVGVLEVLERLRVPIDCIAGTSMGAIVGGLYASGMRADELRETVNSMDWKAVFRDEPPREERDFRRKLEDEDLSVTFKIGIGDGGVRLPRGIILGQQLTLALRALSFNATEVDNFDALPIPFRAIAADVETGDQVVLDRGDLSTAMRASMAVSGVFPPVEIDGRLLVDGGLANNLPMDVVREMGADVLIVSELPTQLQSREGLNSAAAILGQSLSIMVLRSSQAQLRTLRNTDVLIESDLSDLSATSFDRIREMIPRGAEAATRVEDRLRALSTGPEAYAAYLADLPELDVDLKPIAFVELDNRSRISDEVILSRITVAPGEPFDLARLEREIAAVYGLDYFETVTYRLVPDPVGTGIVITVVEKAEGLTTVRLGLNLEYDTVDGSAFTLGGQLRFANLDAFGAEVLVDAALGEENRVDLTYLQPLDFGTRNYLSAGVQLQDATQVQTQDGDRLRDLRVQSVTGTLGYARQLSTWGLATLFANYEIGRLEVETGPAFTGNDEFTVARYGALWRYDSVDDIYFPRDGEDFRLRWVDSVKVLGGERDEARLSGTATTVHSFGDYAVRLSGQGGTSFDVSSESLDAYTLGGLFNLSGYPTDSLTGDHFGFGNLALYRDFGESSPFFDLPLYLGGTVESAAIWNAGEGTGGMLYSGSLFAGIQTPLGPLYLGYGVGGADRHALYFNLGRNFQ